MFDKIKNILNRSPQPQAEPVAPVVQQRIAASILLLEAAHADDHCTEAEMKHITETLKTFLGVDDQSVQEILQLAQDSRQHAVDLWQFTNQINQEFSHQEKLELMKIVWCIVYADGQLDMHEDHFAHKLANLLRLTHKEMIDAKIEAKSTL